MGTATKRPSGKATANAVRKLVKTPHASFDAAYAELNEAQRQAVNTIDGPVMVVAGPGTGKTQVLALRTAKILLSTQVRPSNILCLTFSKSGATAMRARLRQIIGPDAYGVTVNTIHGFCNDIIAGNPAVFEAWSSMKQISDVERYRSLNTIIDQQMPGLHLVHAKSPYDRTGDILARISQLKREGVTDAKKLRSIADDYERELSGKSKDTTKAHQKNLLTARKFRDFVELFLAYQNMLTRTSRYDYEDMILYVIEALKSQGWLLAALQERYQYILVDEFQDTNGAQYILLDTLTHDPTGDNAPNFFVVGDDDQAIYRFQGANLKNILAFKARFPNAVVITLETSYRCTQPILDAANSLIARNTDRLVGTVPGLSKHLRSSTGEQGSAPMLCLAPSDMTEPWMIADMISARLKSGVAPEEIAVIVQTNRELRPLYDVFKACDIPSVLTGKLDLLSHPLVEQAIAILRAADNPHANVDLACALSSACFCCHPADIATLYVLCRERSCSLHDLLLTVDTDTDLRLRDAAKILKARDLLLDLHNKASQRTVLEMLEHVYTDCGLLTAFSAGTLDVVDFAAGQEFFDRIRQRVAEHPEFSFKALLHDLQYYENPEYRELRMSYALPHLTDSGVQIMTAHKSKGLEFHTVICANFREGHWDKRRNPPSVSIPEDLLFGWDKEIKKFEQHEDERRVAYVAMTRAKRALIFTCPSELTTGDQMKTVSPSGFFAEAGNLPEEHRDALHPERMSTLLKAPVRALHAEFEAFLRKRIELFTLSPTALNDFLADPQMFLERHLLQKPEAKNANFAYGNAVHHVLAAWAESVKAGNPLEENAMLALLRNHFEHQEILTEHERSRLIHLGELTLRRYAAASLRPPYPVVHKVEYALKAHLGDIPIKGKIDRIDLLEPHSSAAIITDLKTGKPKSEKQIIEYGYHRQLVFYDLLIRTGYSAIDPKEYRLEFVGEGEEEPLTRSYNITHADREELTKLIGHVWQKILALDFTSL